MPTVSATYGTPRYLLMEDRNPIGPAVAPVPPAVDCIAVYGFSGKPAYDRFVTASNRELRPYPLLKAYLQKQIAAGAEKLRLVILDAEHPNQQSIRAVSMESACNAQSANDSHIDAEYHLRADPLTGVYDAEFSN